MLRSLFLVAAAVSQAAAATIKINVGQDGFVFSPDSVTAQVGDVLEYHFFPGGHSATAGDFNNPCNPPATGGFFSGFMSPSSGESSNVFSVTVNSTDPIFFYCSVPGHCGGGMVGVVNPSSQQSLDAFRSAASGKQAANAPANAFGGVVGPASAASGSTSAPAPTKTPSSGGGGSNPYGTGPAPSAAGVFGVSIVGAMGAVVLAVMLM